MLSASASIIPGSHRSIASYTASLTTIFYFLSSLFAFKRRRNCAFGTAAYISTRFSGINREFEIVSEVFSLVSVASVFSPDRSSGTHVNKSIRSGRFQHLLNMISTSIILPLLQTSGTPDFPRKALLGIPAILCQSLWCFWLVFKLHSGSIYNSF